MENSIKYPKVLEYANITSGSGGPFRSGDVVSMEGVNLKFNPQAEDEGIFWIGGGAPVRTETIITNTASSVKLQIPELAPGDYSLSIATRLGNHHLRETTLEETITIS